MTAWYLGIWIILRLHKSPRTMYMTPSLLPPSLPLSLSPIHPFSHPPTMNYIHTSVAFLGPAVTTFQDYNLGFRIYTVDGDYNGTTNVCRSNTVKSTDYQCEVILQ